MKLIECVPNFSEGKNKKVIDEIVASICCVDGIKLLNVDPGQDTNRTVVTFVGHPKAVFDAAFLGISTAAKLIDMHSHKGEHPRMGATDVCPLIPIRGVSIKECVELSHKLAKRVGLDLKIPVFMYEQSATKNNRRNLADIRKGEYEGMTSKIKEKQWLPDYGPSKINVISGVTAIGVREFLIAYNINLNTSDKRKASDIALDIREAGRAKRNKDGKIIRDGNNDIIKVPGTLKSTKAVGWYLEEFNLAQVSMNLVDYKVTSISKAFEEVRKQARKRGLRVTGSEIVGLVPLDAIKDVGAYFLNLQNKCSGTSDGQLIDMAIKSLGLNSLTPFDPKERIIDYVIKDDHKLVDKTVSSLVDEISIDSPSPGGGSVSALSGSLAAALVSMVGQLSYLKPEYHKNLNLINNLTHEAQNVKNEFLRLIDADSSAFEELMVAFRLPKKTLSDKKIRDKEILDKTKLATDIPLLTLTNSVICMSLIEKTIKLENSKCISDAGVAGEMCYASAYGAYYNVMINLQDINDSSYSSKVITKAQDGLNKIDQKIIKIRKIIKKHLA